MFHDFSTIQDQKPAYSMIPPPGATGHLTTQSPSGLGWKAWKCCIDRLVDVDSSSSSMLIYQSFMWVFPKIGGKPPKMDGENNGSKPYFLMDDLEGKTPPIFGSTPMWFCQGDLWPMFTFRSKVGKNGKGTSYDSYLANG